MKYITLLIVLFYSGGLWAQCPYGEISLTTQAQVDAFKATYPNCQELNGALKIQGSDISSLDSLSEIQSIKGNLDIKGTSLVDLTDIDQLYFVGGEIDITANTVLESIGPFPNLTSAYDIFISLNGSLTSVDLNALTTVTEDLEIFSNLLLSTLDFQDLRTLTSLRLRFSSQITDLSGFGSLEEVYSSLTIWNTGLINLSGLSSLEKVRFFSVFENNSITSLSGCPLLTEIGIQLRISDNPLLTDISTLNTLTLTGPSMRIFNNTNLELCNQPFICNHLSEGKDLSASSNKGNCIDRDAIALNCGYTLDCPWNVDLSSQTEVDNFKTTYPNCTQINGDLSIDGVDIINLDSLSHLEIIGGRLNIENTSLIDSIGLDGLQFVGNGIEIINNGALTSIIGFMNLTSCPRGPIEIVECSNLEVIEGFEALNGYFDGLSLVENESLRKVSGFNGATSMGSVDFESCEALDSIEGFAILDSLSEGIVIELCPSIVVDAFNQVRIIRGSLNIAETAITSINFLTNVESIRGSISIIENEDLETITGLQLLKTLGGSLNIDENTSLTSLFGFGNLEFVGQNFNIRNNIALTSFEDFENLKCIIGEIDILDNEELSSCALEAICAYIENPISPVSIASNATGCNSIAEVSSECSTCPKCYTKIINTWTGGGDGINWSDASNWSLGIVPTDCHDVTIPSPFSIAIDAFSTCLNLTIQAGATVTNFNQTLFLGCSQE